MMLRGNVIIQGRTRPTTARSWAIYNDEASGSPVSFHVTALYNTVVGAGGHAAFLHVSNADGTQMTAAAGEQRRLRHEPARSSSRTRPPPTVSGEQQLDPDRRATRRGSRDPSPARAPASTAPPRYDFTLAAGSACIGAADTTVAGRLPTDEYFENETVTREYRVRASAEDLGAFEHDTTGPGIGPYSTGAGGAGGGSTSSSSSGAGGGSTSSSSSTSGGGGASSGTTGSSTSGSSVGAGGSSSSGGTPQSSGSCKLSTVGGEGPGAAPWLLALMLVAARRRRRS